MTVQDLLSASLSALTKAAGASIFTRPSGAHAFANQEAAEKKPVRESGRDAADKDMKRKGRL
jgi:hypothetical protein